MERAEKGIEALIKHVDALIVIPNQNLITNEMRLTMKQSYAIADEVLKTDVIAIAEIITRHDETQSLTDRTAEQSWRII